MLTFIYGLLDRLPWLVRFAASIPFLRRLFSDIYINLQTCSAPARPHAFSMAESYTTWKSLTDKTFTGRHLPEAQDLPELPPIDKVVALWRRKNNQEILSEETSMLFSFFAQWFTDSFLRTNLLDRRKNTSNHEIDLCQIYGLNEAMTNCLRLKVDGKLKYQIIDGEVYPPYLFDVEKTTLNNWVFANQEFETLHPRYALEFICRGVPEERLKYMFAVGLEHGNSAIGYTILNTIMLREHNRICDLLKASYPDWNDERLFQTTRNIMIVLLIKIVIGDYIGQFSRLDFNLEPSPGMAEKKSWYRTNWISLEFNLLYRWHSMVPETFRIGSEVLPLNDIRSNTQLVTKYGLGPLIDAATKQRTGQIGMHNTPEIFFEPMPFGADTRSVMERTVAMGRDAKLRSFNDYREAFSYSRLRSFDELTDDVELREEIRQLYNDRIDDLEWHVGIFAEQCDPSFMLGRLLTRMVGYDAFTHALTNPLMATAVHNEETFSKPGFELISKPVAMADIIHRNIKDSKTVAASFNTRAQG
ncbi:MAG: peroxidase family protein [Pseudomonadota bacterium]